MTTAVDNIPEQKLADKSLKGVLSTKFGNQLTESELVEMENSLFELTKILFETYLEMEGINWWKQYY